MIRTENFAQVEVASAAELRRWLDGNHHQTESVWLIAIKKPTVTSTSPLAKNSMSC